MAAQLAIDFAVRPISSAAERRWRDFHAANPRVYQVLRDLALHAVRRGKRKVGMKALWETARWHVWLETNADDYRFNNSFTAYYARELMRREPELRGVFEARRLRAL